MKKKGHCRIGNDWLRRESPVKGNRLLVLIYLRSRANKSDRCWPSIETIAEDLGLGESTVKRALRELEGSALILRFRDRDSGGQWERTVYEVADLRSGPGVTVAPGPGVTVAPGPQVKATGQSHRSQWPTNNPQENNTHRNNPKKAPAGIALRTGENREIDPTRDVPGWGAIEAFSKRAGISSGQIAEKIFEGIPPAYVLGYLLEKIRKAPKIRTSSAAWFADKCKRRRAPAAEDYDQAKRALRPYLELVALPGMRFDAVLPGTGEKKDPKKGLREKLVRLELEAAAQEEGRRTG